MPDGGAAVTDAQFLVALFALGVAIAALGVWLESEP